MTSASFVTNPFTLQVIINEKCRRPVRCSPNFAKERSIPDRYRRRPTVNICGFPPFFAKNAKEDGARRITGLERLLPHADPQRLHLAIEMATFQAEQLRGAADVVARFFNLLEDVLALVSVAGLLEAGELLGRPR